MCSLTQSCLSGGALSETPRLHAPSADGAPVPCKKCGEAPAAVNLRSRDAYCRQCFLSNMVHKFRSGLGKRKALRPGDKVAVAFSGGAGSQAMLRLLAEGEEESSREGGRRRKIPLDAVVALVVDETALFFGDDADKRAGFVREVVSRALDFPFPVHLVRLEDAVDRVDRGSVRTCSREKVDEICVGDDERSRRLRAVFDGTAETTAKEALLDHLRKKALSNAARALSAGKVLTGESATRLSVRLLSGLATGRGAHLARETAYCAGDGGGGNGHGGGGDGIRGGGGGSVHGGGGGDGGGGDGEVVFVRPMSEFSRKEVAMYNAFRRSPAPSVIPTFSAGREVLASVERLTEDFLVGLQQDFPATVPTVLRIGAKLTTATTSAHDGDGESRCALCGGRRRELPSSRARDAVAFSRMVSTAGPGGFTNVDLSAAGVAVMELDRQQSLDLCRSCAVTAEQMEDPDLLLDFIRRKKSEEEVEGEIGQFLL